MIEAIRVDDDVRLARSRRSEVLPNGLPRDAAAPSSRRDDLRLDSPAAPDRKRSERGNLASTCHQSRSYRRSRTIRSQRGKGRNQIRNPKLEIRNKLE